MNYKGGFVNPYVSTTMWQISSRWNKEIYGLEEGSVVSFEDVVEWEKG